MPRWLDTPLACGADVDRRWALALHRGAAHPGLLRLLRVCSRAGDWPMWVMVVLLLTAAGPGRWRHHGVVMLALGTVNLLSYWALKRLTRRPRPCSQCPGIRACVPTPDVFSFPSGHALHATAFALVLGAWLPAWAPVLALFALLVAVSRVVLGMHYPSDVLVGCLIGASTASLALVLG
jgi:undecaprenyl-diphosphatase